MKFTSLLAIASLITLCVSDDDSLCNPLKSSDCPSDPALADSFKEDFTSKSKYFDVVNSKGLSYTDEGLNMSLTDRYDNPSIKSNFYIMFGKVEVVMKAASGQGIISSFYLQSDDLDEIDIEFFGGDAYQFQSNFFSKGNTTTFTRGEYESTPGSPMEDFITYTIDWTNETLTWAMNGDVVRTLYPDDPQGYPQSPMFIMAGIWAGGDPDNPQGTIEWAGGETTYGPTYSMFIKSVIVTDYSTGDKYEYSDNTGDWESIKSINGQINGRISKANSEFDDLVDEVTDDDDASSTSTSVASTSLGITKSSSSSSSTKSSPSTSLTSPTTTQSTVPLITSSYTVPASITPSITTVTTSVTVASIASSSTASLIAHIDRSGSLDSGSSMRVIPYLLGMVSICIVLF